jgi:hypothetical protein
LLWAFGEQAVGVLLKAGAEHLVALVDHNGVDTCEREVAAVDKVDKAPRGANDAIDAGVEALGLLGDWGAAVGAEKRE